MGVCVCVWVGGGVGGRDKNCLDTVLERLHTGYLASSPGNAIPQNSQVGPSNPPMSIHFKGSFL